MYRVNLTDEQRLELHRRAHQREVAPTLRDRLEMVRLSDAGWSVPKIAVHLSQHEQTVRRWIKAFVTGGFDALADKPRGGKTSALTPAILNALVSHVRASQQTWSAAQLCAWVAQEHHVHLSVGRMRLHLRRAQLSYKRTSRSLKHKQKPQEVTLKSISLECLQKGAMPDCST
jgi:putative transposase